MSNVCIFPGVENIRFLDHIAHKIDIDIEHGRVRYLVYIHVQTT